MKRKNGMNTEEVFMNLDHEKKLKSMNELRERKDRVKKGELQFKDMLESSGRLSYFTELFEGIPLNEQNIEVEGFPNPTEAYFFKKGREIAEKLVRNNIATIENYGEFCKVETGKIRNGR